LPLSSTIGVVCPREGPSIVLNRAGGLKQDIAGTMVLENGLGPGDRVVLILENCLEYVVSPEIGIEKDSRCYKNFPI
jgi:hypothetical protein